MATQTWLALIIIGFLLSPSIGLSVVGLYLFNYSTAIIFRLWAKYQHRGQQ